MAGKLGNPMAGAASAERDAGKKDDAAPLTGKVRGRAARRLPTWPGKAGQK